MRFVRNGGGRDAVESVISKGSFLQAKKITEMRNRVIAEKAICPLVLRFMIESFISNNSKNGIRVRSYLFSECIAGFI